MASPLQNPHSCFKPSTINTNLNPSAEPYFKSPENTTMVLYQPIPPPKMEELHPPPPLPLLPVPVCPYFYVYQSFQTSMAFYNRQPFLVTPTPPELKPEYYSISEQPSHKKLAPFFPGYDSQKKFGARKNKSPPPRVSYREKSGVRKTGKAGLELKTVCNGDKGSIFRGKTSLMIRNIPNILERHQMLEILDKHCLEENKKAKLHPKPIWSKYDFFYLPMDFSTGANRGFAFVNFTNPVAASRFRDAFQNYKWDTPNNRKICEVSVAVIQGREAFWNHFRKSVFFCKTDDYLPVILSPPSPLWYGSGPSKLVPVGTRYDRTRKNR